MALLSCRRFPIGASLAAACLFPAALLAGDAAPQKSKPEEGPPTIELTVSPAAAPVPALKVRLLPSPSERTHGNAALDYYRALVQFSVIPEQNVPMWVKTGDLADVALDKFPQEKVAKELEKNRAVLAALERATRRDHCEWQVPLEGFETQLPEFQNIRDPVRLVTVRARLQMARGDLDAALDSFKINYQLTQNITECPTIINSLIGVAICSLTRGQLETFVQQPHAPNLYWALSELPVPLINFRRAIVMEPFAIEKSFPEIVELRSRRLTPDEARRLSNRILEKWVKLGITTNLPKTVDEAERRFAASAEVNYPEAKQMLIEAGRPRGEVEAMPVEQAIWVASFRRWQLFWDDLIKWTFLPAPQRRVGLDEVERRIAQFHDAHRDAIFELTELIASVPAALAAGDRADRQLALLRIEEAIRLYASAHSGQLPESLDKIDAVPIPVDPSTGTAFAYRLEGDRAFLETPPAPKNAPENKFQARRYIIQMRK
jgi:hypothetical protein